ncbi:MAG: type II secretion system F family protein [Verrucomicrobia bacterium]|nr:type II secretion system F family protein [Verrucomicrobiota bacterium]
MADFVYTARTKSGQKVDGTVEATDRRGAMSQIEAKGLIPVSVMEGSSAAKKAAGGPKKRRGLTLHRGPERMGSREVLMFTQELSDLLASGMTLGNALNTLSNRRTGKPGDTIVAGLRDEIIRGTNMSDAFAKYPGTFSHLYVSMIQAGEASGAMDEVLKRVVEHYERVQDTKEKVGMALTYPLIVTVLGIATMIFCMVKVVPQFQTIFDDLDEALPAATRMLIDGSSWCVKYGWLALIIMTIAGILIQRALKTHKGKRWLHSVLLKTPLIKGIVAAGTYSNLARTLGTLLGNGVPVLQALGIVERTAGNLIIGEEIARARERVTDGASISGPLAAGKVLPEMFTDMLAIGEQTGDMSSALKHIARRYENELDRNIKIFTTALEPLLIVGVAVGVGFVAVSILMAVFSLTNGLDV